MDKKRYYVTMNAEHMEVRDEKIPDPNLIQHEIEATEEELESVTKLVEKASSEDLIVSDILQHQFDEDFSDKDREVFQEDFDKLHRMIYQLGTPETKRKLDQF